MLWTPWKWMSGQSADRTSVRIASTEDEEVDEEWWKEDDVEITEDYNEMTEEEKLKLDAEAVDETRESKQDILQEKMNEEEITLDERQDIIELAGVKKTVNLQVTWLKPWKNTIFLIDWDGKKLQIEVITTERIVTVKQWTDVWLRMPVWLTATNTNRWIKAKQNHDGYGVAYSRRNSRTGQLYYVSWKMLGTYTIQLPVRNTASRKKDDRFGIMQVTVNVATAREDSQAQRQQKAKAFSMSHDQLQMNVWQTIHIWLDGYWPFQVRRKWWWVVWYVWSTGGTRVASAWEEEEDEWSEDLITIKDEFSSNITDKEREIFQQSSEMLVDTWAIQMWSWWFYLLEGEEFKKNPDADEGWWEGEEQIEIASAWKQWFTIVWLVPWDEILYVTDIKWRTQNIVVQVKETDLKTYLDEESSKRSVRGEETVKKEIGRRWGESYERFWESRQRLWYVYWLSARYYWNKKYLKNAYWNRQKTRVKYFSINALPTSPWDIAVTFLNTYEQWADTTRRNERKYTQQMKFSTNKKTQPVKKLSYPDSYYDVPDYFTANGTIKMQVGQMKTIQVWSQWWNYSYWKANHNIWWINGTSQNVRVANAGGTEATWELIDGDTVVWEDDKDLTDIWSWNLLEIPAEIGEEEVTQEMLQEIDQRWEEQDPESDVSYEENTVAPEGDVEIASVNGKAATFVALRPGISYIYVKYSNGRSEKMKVIISPKVITKNYNQTLNLTSTGNLAIRKMWSKTKKWEQLSFSKKPKKRRTANDTYRRLKASSIVWNDTLYVQIYNRVERKFMYLELHTKVNKPPITSSFKSLNMTVWQTTLIRAAWWAGKLSIIKGNDRIGRIKNTHKDIEVASAWSGGVNEHSEEERVIQSYTWLVDDGVDVEPDLEVEVVPTKEQLAMVPDESETGTWDDESDRAPTEATSWSWTVQIASNWRMTVPLQALRPGRVDVVVTDQHKQSRRINLNVLPKVITKKRGESLKLNAPYDLPIMYVKTKAKTEITYKKRPKWYRYGWKWEIDTTNFQPIETVYVRHYNRKEKKYQRVELTVKTETQPLKVSTEKVDRIRSWSMNTVTITGWVVPYKITQTGNASVSISHGKGKTTKDNNLHYMVLKWWRTVFIITDAQWKKKTVTVTSQMDEIQVKQRDKLSFNGSEWMPIKSVSSKSWVHYAYKQSGLNMSVETEKMDKNDTLVIHVEDKVMWRGFSYEVDLIVTALTTLDPPEWTWWEYCAEHNQSCDFRWSYIVAYWNKWKFNEKRYETWSAVCTHTTFWDPYPGMRKWCWIKEVSKLTVSKSALSVTAGEIVTVKVFWWTPSYTINKANHNIMLADSASGGVKIASAEEEWWDSDEFVIWSVEEEYEELPVDDTGELVPLPTDEELEALAQIQWPEVLSTGELDNETWGEETWLEIASVGKAIHIMWLVPGKSKVTIIDQYKRTVSIDITVKPTTLLKQPWDIVTVYSTKEIPIRFVRLYNKQPQMEASPKSWTQGGAWNIKTHNFNSKETLRPLIYSTGEKRYYWMSLDVQLKEVKKMPEQQEPILYLPFDGNTKDKIGNYDLSEQGKIAYVEWIQGKWVKLWTSWLSIPHHIWPQITWNMTVSFWIRPDTFVGRQNPLSKSYGGEISFTQEPNGRISTYFWLKGTNWHPYAWFRPGDEVKKGEWNHVTMVKNIKTMKRQVYVNGKKTERWIPTAFTKASAWGSELKIGKWYAGMYKWTMDELRIYNRSLSEKEVQELRSLKKEPKTIVPQQEPIWHRTFDETTNESKKSYTTSVSWSPLYGEWAIGKSLQLWKTTLSIPASIGEEMTWDLTVSMWLKPDSFAERMNPIAKAYGWEFTMTQEPSGRMTWFFGTRWWNGSPYTWMHSKNSVTLKKWNHVAFVRDLKAKKFWMYVNGDRTEKAIPSSFLQPKLSANALTIGKWYVKPYEGSIDDLRIYNRALSEKEIGELWGMKKEESTPIYNPKLESLSLPWLWFAFATVQRDVVPKSAQIEYSKWGTEKVEITDKASVALIDEKKGEWKITYVKSDGKKGEVKRGVSIASVGDEWGGLEIASAVQDWFDDTWWGRICTTKRWAKFYKAYKSTCEVWHESTARNCFVWLREYEVNNDLIQWESCLNPYTNLKNEDQYNRIIKKIVDEWRKNEWSRKKEILSILERFVENNLEMKTESIFLYIHDHVASWFSVPEVTEDFRKKLMESGEKMRKKKKTVWVSSNNILELYSYFTRKVWPDWWEWDFKNIDVNKGWYWWYANLIMWWKIFKVDDPWNINFWYAWKMGELSLKVIIKWSLYAQYWVDLKIMDPDWNEVKMDTPDNEKLDALSIIRWYLLWVKYPWNNLPISYIDDLYWFDIEKYAESIWLSSFNDESSNTIYYLTPGMILKK